jgi:hypothetical protein
LNLVFMGLEVTRFFALVALVPGLAGSSDGMIQGVASANLAYALAFFFIWLDQSRYGSYRLLVAVGKAVGSIFVLRALSAALASGTPALVPAAALVYDVASIAFAFRGSLAKRETRTGVLDEGAAGIGPIEPPKRSPAPASPQGQSAPAQGSGVDAPDIETIDP